MYDLDVDPDTLFGKGGGEITRADLETFLIPPEEPKR